MPIPQEKGEKLTVKLDALAAYLSRPIDFSRTLELTHIQTLARKIIKKSKYVFTCKKKYIKLR